MRICRKDREPAFTRERAACAPGTPRASLNRVFLQLPWAGISGVLTPHPNWGVHRNPDRLLLQMEIEISWV